MSKPTNWPEGVPYIDPAVRHVGISTLRLMHATAVARLEGILVIRDGDEPIGVLMPYAIYLEMQRTAEAKEKV